MTNRTQDNAQRPADAGSRRRPWTLLILLCAAQFMVILDATVVNVALPSIRRALHLPPSDLQWVVTAYILATGSLLLLGGRARADLFGRRRTFLAGLATFHGGVAGQRGGAVRQRAHRRGGPPRASAPRCSPPPRSRSSPPATPATSALGR